MCTGEMGISKLSERPLYYKNSIIHRSIKDFMIQGGGAFVLCNIIMFRILIFHNQILQSAMVWVGNPFTADRLQMKTSRVPWTQRG